jgi:hypothetical protein
MKGYPLPRLVEMKKQNLHQKESNEETEEVPRGERN